VRTEGQCIGYPEKERDNDTLSQKTAHSTAPYSYKFYVPQAHHEIEGTEFVSCIQVTNIHEENL